MCIIFLAGEMAVSGPSIFGFRHTLVDTFTKDALPVLRVLSCRVQNTLFTKAKLHFSASRIVATRFLVQKSNHKDGTRVPTQIDRYLVRSLPSTHDENIKRVKRSVQIMFAAKCLNESFISTLRT